jgi:hypothetical protein
MAPRAIVEELNRRGVPPPGLAYRRRSTTAPSWCGSALTGNAKYGLGLLNCRLYQGELVWGRSRWSKDPDTKRKRRTLCPEHEWITRSVPHLRIIDDELWEKVRTRQQAVHDASAAIRAALRANARTGRGPKYLFSGLLTCGLCGHKFIVVDPLQYACSGWKYRGACANTVKVARKVVEALLLEAIQHELFTEEGLARFEQQVAKRLREHQQARKPERAQAEQYLQQVEREIENIMTAIKAGVVTPTTKAELEKAEATRAALLRTIKGHEATGSKVTAILPDMIGRFRTMVENLVTVTQPQVDKARASLRMLLGKEIVLHPSADGAERYLTAEVSGNYAGLVQLVTGKNKFGGGDATLPKLTEALSFRIHAIAFVA